MGNRTIPGETQLLSAQIRSGDKAAIKRVVEALEASGGDISKAAESLGTTRHTLYNRGSYSPELAKAVEKHKQGRGKYQRDSK